MRALSSVGSTVFVTISLSLISLPFLVGLRTQWETIVRALRLRAAELFGKELLSLAMYVATAMRHLGSAYVSGSQNVEYSMSLDVRFYHDIRRKISQCFIRVDQHPQRYVGIGKVSRDIEGKSRKRFMWKFGKMRTELSLFIIRILLNENGSLLSES